MAPRPLLSVQAFRWTVLLALPAAGDAVAANAAPVGIPQVAQVIGALLLVVVVIFAVAALAQRVKRLQQGRGRLLQVVDGIALNARDRLVLVDVDGQRLLLGVSPGRIERLHVLPAARANPPGMAPFATALADARVSTQGEAKA